jgi:hypothetical protein
MAAFIAWWRPMGTGHATTHWVAYPLLVAVGVVSALLTAFSATRAVRTLLTTSEASQPRPALLNDALEFSVNLTVLVVVTLLIVLLLLLGRYDLDQPRDSI